MYELFYLANNTECFFDKTCVFCISINTFKGEKPNKNSPFPLPK